MRTSQIFLWQFRVQTVATAMNATGGVQTISRLAQGLDRGILGQTFQCSRRASDEKSNADLYEHQHGKTWSFRRHGHLGKWRQVQSKSTKTEMCSALIARNFCAHGTEDSCGEMCGSDTKAALDRRIAKTTGRARGTEPCRHCDEGIVDQRNAGEVNKKVITIITNHKTNLQIAGVARREHSPFHCGKQKTILPARRWRRTRRIAPMKHRLPIQPKFPPPWARDKKWAVWLANSCGKLAQARQEHIRERRRMSRCKSVKCTGVAWEPEFDGCNCCQGCLRHVCSLKDEDHGNFQSNIAGT